MGYARAAAESDGTTSFLDHLIEASDVRWNERIAVAGRESLDVCLSLYRRGYDHAICRSIADAPHTPEQEADVLWLLGVPREMNPATMLNGLGRDLRPGGRLVVRLPRDTSFDQISRWRQLLIERGFLPTAAAGDFFNDCRLISARKAGRPRAQAA